MKNSTLQNNVTERTNHQKLKRKKVSKFLVTTSLICSFIFMGCNSYKPNLLTKSYGTNLSVKYSQGFEKKADIQYNRLLGMQKFYKEYIGKDIHATINLLNEKDWNAITDVPYGIPHMDPEQKIHQIYVPATEDGILVEDAMSYQDIVPVNLLNKFKEAGYTYEEGVKLFPDLIGLHEVGHSLVNDSILIFWFNEFMSTYYAYSYLMKTDENLAKIWVANSKVTYLDGSKPKYKTLKEFEDIKTDVGPINYDWIQKQFAYQADVVYQKKGIDFIKEVDAVFAGKNYSVNEAIEKLEEIVPVFKSWVEDLKNF